MLAAVEDLVFKLKRNAKTRLREAGIYILVDGNIKLDLKYPSKNIIKGDGKSKTIACASIIAKVIRDRIMYLYDKVYPAYGFISHKGYPTPKHKSRLKELGPTPIHRKSFSYV
jgi:ribonuclease HII